MVMVGGRSFLYGHNFVMGSTGIYFGGPHYLLSLLLPFICYCIFSSCSNRLNMRLMLSCWTL